MPKSAASTKSRKSLKTPSKAAKAVRELSPVVPSPGKGKRKAIVLLDESDSDLEVIVVEKIKVAKEIPACKEDRNGARREEPVEQEAMEDISAKADLVEIAGEEAAVEEERNNLGKDDGEGASDGEWGGDEIVGSDIEMELHGDDDDESYGDDFDLPLEAQTAAETGQTDSDAEMARQIEEDEREQGLIVQGSSKDLVAYPATALKGPSCPGCSTSLPVDKNEVSRCSMFAGARG